MDKRRISPEIDRRRYSNFLEVKRVAGDAVMTSAEIFKLFKENDIPASAKYFTYMMKGNFFTKVSVNHYKFNRNEITFDQFRKCLLDAREYDQIKKAKAKANRELVEQGLPKLTPVSKQEKINKYIEFLKGEGYKVQKPVQVQRIVYDTVYEEC